MQHCMTGAGNEHDTELSQWLLAFMLHLPVPLSHVLHRMIAWQAERYTLEMMRAAGLDTMRANMNQT